MINVSESVKKCLKIKNVEVPSEWISACIQFLQSEHAHQPENICDSGWLSQKAFEQWQFTDLTELGCGYIPPGLPDVISGVLDKDYTLQINSLKEVGLPAYSQLQQLRKEDLENSLIDTDKPKQQSWEPKPSRLLLLAVTDGVTQLQAMEYTPIPALSLHTKPGTKILVRGGVAVRRGVLLLTAAHITVLGGAVDALLAPNAPENVINRALGLEETEIPREYEDPPPPPPTVPPSQASQYYPGTQPPSQRAAVRNVVLGRNDGSSNNAMPTRTGVPSRNGVLNRNAMLNRTAVLGRNGNGAVPQNTSSQRNNFNNLWNDSQAFGRPADQSVADPIAAFAGDDEFLDMDVEAALLEAETQLSAAAASSNSCSTTNTGGARGSSGPGNARPNAHSATKQLGGVFSNATSGSSNSTSTNANTGVGMSINLSKSASGANKALLKKPINNPFIDSNFPDDDFEDADLGAIEEEVKIIESQESRPNQTIPQISSNFQKPQPVHGPQPNSCVNSAKISPLRKEYSRSNLNDYDSCNRSNLHGNDKPSLNQLPSINRPSGKRPSDADSDHETEKSSKQVKLNKDSSSSLASKIKSMAQGESSNSVSTVASLAAGPPSKIIASSSVSNSNTTTKERETARVGPLTRPESSLPSAATRGPSSVGGTLNANLVTTAVKTKPPFTYLCFLPDKSSVDQEFIVKGFVMTLVSRLDPSSGQWRLPVKINDGSCSLDVDIHDQVLQKLIGMSVPEMRANKARASTDPSIRAMLAKSVNGCQKELISLCCLLTLCVSPAAPRPMLVALTPIQDCHAQQLADRALGL